jgi:hypothetical protein
MQVIYQHGLSSLSLFNYALVLLAIYMLKNLLEWGSDAIYLCFPFQLFFLLFQLHDLGQMLHTASMLLPDGCRGLIIGQYVHHLNDTL